MPQADYYVSLIAKRSETSKSRAKDKTEAIKRAKQTDPEKLAQIRREMEENRRRIFGTSSPEAVAAKLKNRKRK